MHRTVAALLVGALGLLAPALPAAAQNAREDAAAAAIGADVLTVAPAAGSSVDGSGAGFALSVDPGQDVQQVLTVGNTSPDRRLTVRVQPVDATRRGERIEYSDTATATGGGAWITASLAVVVVEPGTTVDVPIAISVPAGAAGGDTVLAGVRVYTERADSTTGAAAVIDDLPARQVPIELAVIGAPTAQLAITRVVADEDNGHTYLDITLRNSGNAPAHANGKVRAPGDQYEEPLDVEVDARKEKTVRVEWRAVDIASGANVSIELDYGDGDTASWIGKIAADPEATVVSVPTADGTVPPADTNTEDAAARSSRSNPVGTLLAIAMIALMLGAGGWLLFELARGRAPRTIAIDPATMPQLQVVMDPRHTDVLNALVSQVGALGGAIEKLAERAGVPVVIPAAPSPLRPARGRHHGTRHEPAPVVVAPPAPPSPPRSEPIARVTSMLQTPSPRPASPLPRRVPAEPEPDLHVPPPTFIPPPPVEEVAGGSEPSDSELRAFLERRRADDGDFRPPA